MVSFTITPSGPFTLEAAQDFAGGFAPGLGGHGKAEARGLLMAFPLENWTGSAAVDLWQDESGAVHGEVYGTDQVSAARAQAARAVSLDHDGSGWASVGERDPVIGRLQQQYRFLRPVCFYSAYEAATNFVIGQRISMRQGAAVKRRLAEAVGDSIDLGGHPVSAFPRPQRLLELEQIAGISAEKVRRLHGLARAALDGELDTGSLRALSEEEALARLQALPGIGAWTAQGVLMRGCGLPDSIPTQDTISRAAVRHFYDLPADPTDAEWLRISDTWRPYRMWATVLLHMAWRREPAATEPSTPRDSATNARR